MRYRALILLGAAVGVFALSSPAVAAAPDLIIQWAAKRHWSEPYRSNPDLLVAQCWAESKLDAGAVSPAGAIGVCQVLPGTAADVLGRGQTRGRIRAALRNAKDNAEIAARYMARMYRVWSFPRSAWCRWRLAVASYNAGPGSIIKAQRLSGGRSCFEDIAPFLHEVTGKHAAETIAYVTRVEDEVRRRRGQGLIR